LEDFLLKQKYLPLFWGLMILAVLITSCSSTGQVNNVIAKQNTPTPALTQPLELWIAPNIPEKLKSDLFGIPDVNVLKTPDKANLLFQIKKSSEGMANEIGSIQWIYALEAPFPTLTDGLSLDELQRIWLGNVSSDDPLDTIQVSEETRKVFDALWGTSSTETVVSVPEVQLQNNDFTSMRNWAIVPFEQITPRWKVIKIGGLSAIDKPLDVNAYALTVNFSLINTGSEKQVTETGKKVFALLSKTNRDEAKMTVLMMTGTTAMTRADRKSVV
jgi:hypothetical protein